MPPLSIASRTTGEKSPGTFASTGSTEADAPAPQSESQPKPAPQSAPQPTPVDETPLSTLAAGTYFGRVTSDSQGPSRSNITVILTPLGDNAVRLTSPYARIETLDIELTRIGDKLYHSGGDTVLILDLTVEPPQLAVNPHNSLAYVGIKRSATGP